MALLDMIFVAAPTFLIMNPNGFHNQFHEQAELLTTIDADVGSLADDWHTLQSAEPENVSYSQLWFKHIYLSYKIYN